MYTDVYIYMNRTESNSVDFLSPQEQDNNLQLNWAREVDSLDRDESLDDVAETIQSVAFLYLDKKRANLDNHRLNLLKQKIHDILFDNQESIPEGVYLQLMDAIK